MLDYVTPPFRLSLNRAAARWRFWTALALALPLATLAVLDYGVSGTSLQPADAPLLTILAAIVVLLAAYAAVAAFQAFGDAPSTRIDVTADGLVVVQRGRLSALAWDEIAGFEIEPGVSRLLRRSAPRIRVMRAQADAARVRVDAMPFTPSDITADEAALVLSEWLALLRAAAKAGRLTRGLEAPYQFAGQIAVLPAPKPVETVVAVKPVESVIEVAEAPAAANEDGADAASPPLDVEADPAPHAADVTEKEDEVQASPALQMEEPVEEAAESLIAPEELETPPAPEPEVVPEPAPEPAPLARRERKRLRRALLIKREIAHALFRAPQLTEGLPSPAHDALSPTSVLARIYERRAELRRT